MSNSISSALLAILDNQVARTDAALDGLREDVFTVEPGGGCNSILGIGRHLVVLRRFQLALLESLLAAEVTEPASVETPDELRAALTHGAGLVARAIADHDPDDWERVPDPPREGKWGDEATLHRFVRPLNDFTNHLGAIRAIRRLHGNAIDRTQ